MILWMPVHSYHQSATAFRSSFEPFICDTDYLMSLLTARAPRFKIFPPSVTTPCGTSLATFGDDPTYDPSASRASMKSFCKHTATTASRGVRLMQAAAPPLRDRDFSAFAWSIPQPTKTSLRERHVGEYEYLARRCAGRRLSSSRRGPLSLTHCVEHTRTTVCDETVARVSARYRHRARHSTAHTCGLSHALARDISARKRD